MLLVLSHVETGRYQLVSSDAIEQEIANMNDAYRREKVEEFLRLSTHFAQAGKREWDGAGELESQGFTPLDALHLACAEGAGVDMFLTTDDRLLKRSRRHPGKLRVRVANPAEWLLEV